MIRHQAHLSDYTNLETTLCNVDEVVSYANQRLLRLRFDFIPAILDVAQLSLVL